MTSSLMSSESDALLAPPRTLSPLSTVAPSSTRDHEFDDNDNHRQSDEEFINNHRNNRHNDDDDDDDGRHNDDDDSVSVTSSVKAARTKREEAKGFYCLPYRGPVAQEWRRFVDLAGPLIIGYMSINAMLTEDLAFVGQIGPVDLAAMNLSNAILFATLVLPIGFTNAVRVLAAQSYGAGQTKNVGLWVQVGLALSAILFLIPISLVWLFAGNIVCAMNLQAEELEYLDEENPMIDAGIAAGAALFDNVTSTISNSMHDSMMSHSQMMVEHELCEKASTFGRVSLLWLWPLVIYNVLTCILEALEIVWPATLLTLLFVGVNFGLNYVFLSWLELGLVGSALATSVSKILQLILMLVLILKYYKLQTVVWSPWSRECLRWHRVKPFLKLGLPMMATEAMYDWVFEISIIISGTFGIAEAAATGVLINLVFFFTPLLTGVYIAVAVRVSTLLGERDIEGAKRAVWISVQAAVAISLAGGGLMVALRDYIPRIYTADDEVMYIVTDFTPLAAVDFILSSFAFVMQGVLEGQSRPHWGTASSIAGTWMIGLPMSALLAIEFEMEMTGLWIGMLIGEGSKLILMLIAVMRTNWRNQCEIAIKAVADEDAMLNEAAGITNYGTVPAAMVVVDDNEADDASVEFRRK